MTRNFLRIFLTLLPALAALAVILLILLFLNADIAEVIEAFQKGAYLRGDSVDLGKVSSVLEFWIPLVLVSMGLVVTFTAGLWNIGVEGQMIIGGLFAAAVAFTFEDIGSPLILLPLEILAAMLGGILWGVLIGILKTKLGVNEIFSGVALNAIAALISLQFIAGPWRPEGTSNSTFSRPFIPEALFQPINDDFSVSMVALIVVFVAIALVIWILKGTRWGLNLKATGKNPRSALLLGVATDRTSIGALAFCGALAGIAGAHRVLFTFGDVRTSFSGGIGFLGLLVVLLVSIRPVWVPIVALLFAAMLRGGTQLQFIGLPSSLTGVLQGAMVLAVMIGSGVRDRLRDRFRLSGNKYFESVPTSKQDSVVEEIKA